jgi:hypothetical protein
VIAVHSALAFVAAAGVVALLAAAAATSTGALASRTWLDRAILVQAVAALGAAIAGLAAALAGRPPSDALHLVYGAVLVVVGLGARYLARDTGTRRLGGVMTVVALVLAGVVVRSFMTGN